ncbi:hypothetical protein SISSUDRAFT_964957, partial [Sistotremastrum suecicum HHB10207 ss-3]
KCLLGTRKTIIKEIMEWAVHVERDNASSSNVFWLSGVAGSGKTSIAHTISELCASMGLLGSSFFFKHDEAGRNELMMMLSTMIVDLAAFNPKIAEVIHKVITLNPSMTEVQRYFCDLILKSIRDSGYSNPILLVLDAFDDC